MYLPHLVLELQACRTRQSNELGFVVLNRPGARTDDEERAQLGRAPGGPVAHGLPGYQVGMSGTYGAIYNQLTFISSVDLGLPEIKL